MKKRLKIILRSMLFVPGSRPERIDKAAATAADAVIVDLEDAVAVDAKETARATACAKRARHPERLFWVRVNGLDTGFFEDDLKAVAAAGVDGVMVPKIETPQQVAQVLSALEECIDRSAGDGSGPMVAALIESALGVQNAFAVASAGAQSRRFLTLALGAADFTADMGIDMTAEAFELHYPRARLAVACRAAGLAAPLDTPYMIAVKDSEGVTRDAVCARRLGFQGKLCIHPLQISPVNSVFSPGEAEIAFARKVCAAFESAQTRGQAAVTVDGRFVDPPVVERARQISRWLENQEKGS